MLLKIILTIIIIQYCRKSLQSADRLPKWDLLLKIEIGISIMSLVIENGGPGASLIAAWIINIILLSLVYLSFYHEEFKPVKSTVYIILPYVIVALIGDVVNLINIGFLNAWTKYIDTAKFFAVIWMIAMWFITRRQKRVIQKQQDKLLEKEKENQVTESLKAALEVQVAERTAALTLQKEELQHALQDLKATQAHLIQAEKMASLGELIAGIAHEIQNPLNFVNNFSEVNKELIDELEQEIEKGNLKEVKVIAKDIKENEKKITYHGKRADAIVKGMLQHSRVNSGVKESTDINALTDEYLRLAYHGLRAKDKSFNATMKTDYDPTIGTINIIPQDIGRVILNLITNAFYAVTEKRKQMGEIIPTGQVGYEPTVSISTRLLIPPSGGLRRIEIRVADNGNGIPKRIINKIFQPFFTTKPTGQGTGLGLSLSYDIVKAHGGEIKVETKEARPDDPVGSGEGSTFIIQLPIA